jgi:hypothetical protein
LGFNVAGFINGFLAQSEKIHKDQLADQTMKLKVGEAADKHMLAQAHSSYYAALTNSKTAGGVSAKDASVIARRAEGVRASQAKDRRDAERFELQKQGKWDPSGRGAAGPKGALPPLDEAPGAVQAAQDRLGGAPAQQGAIPGTNGVVRPWPAQGGAVPAVGGASAPGTQAAAEDDEESQTAETEPDEGDEDDEPVERAAKGGMVGKYAAGGMVGKPAVGCYADGGAVQPQPQQAPQQPQPAIGGQPQQAMPPVQDFNATPADSGKSWNNDEGFDTKSVLAGWKAAPEPASKAAATDGASKSDPANVNGARFALSAMQDVYRASKGASALDAGHQAMVDGIGKKENAMTDAQYKQLGQAVDPRGQLNESAGYIARLDATIKSSLVRGDQKAAKALATSLTEYGALKSEQYGNYALDLMKKGDMQGAIHFLEKAYDFQPDGKTLQATVGSDGLVHAQTTDADGKVADLGKFSAQQVLKVTLGLANGSEYYQAMARIAAGGKADKPAAAPKPMPVPPVSARHTAAQAIDTEHAQTITREDGKVGPKWTIPAETKDLEASIAAQLHASSNVDPAAAVRAVSELTNLSDKKTFKMQPNQDGTATAVLGDGTRLQLSSSSVAQLGAVRAKKEEMKKAAEAKASADKKKEDEAGALEKSQAAKLAAKREKWTSEEYEQDRKKAEAERASIRPRESATD